MIEYDILLWIQNHLRNDFLTPIFMFITSLGNKGIIWILFAVILLIQKKTRNVGVMVLISLALSLLIDNILLKNIVARIRPYEVVPGLKSMIGVMTDYSFPSGHTGSSFAAAVIMYCGLPKKYGIPAIILAALIGFSRLYVGVHFPSDVICGAMIGTGIALITFVLANKMHLRKVKE